MLLNCNGFFEIQIFFAHFFTDPSKNAKHGFGFMLKVMSFVISFITDNVTFIIIKNISYLMHNLCRSFITLCSFIINQDFFPV
jgi:hypothetical protein